MSISTLSDLKNCANMAIRLDDNQTPVVSNSRISERNKKAEPILQNYGTDFCKPENVLAMVEAKNRYGMYPINLE